LEFSYNEDAAYDYNNSVGIYDTKEKKVLIQPSVDDIIEWNEDCIKVYTRNVEYGKGDFRQHYINSKGEILYPWLYNKGFSIVEIPDVNKVTAVAISKFTELSGNPGSFFEHNGIKYSRKHIYGLYSSKGKFLLPIEYDNIKNLCNNIWACSKDGIITIVETEKEDFYQCTGFNENATCERAVFLVKENEIGKKERDILENTDFIITYNKKNFTEKIKGFISKQNESKL
jgi:hypothetical protein